MMEARSDFERQLTRVASEMAGPVRPIDTTAILRAAKAGPVGRWSLRMRVFGAGTTTPTERGFSMFSAAKFTAASAIVALFGGFLIASILSTQQADQVPPGTATHSPSPLAAEQRLVSGREVIDLLFERSTPIQQWGSVTQAHGWIATLAVAMDDPWASGTARYISNVDIIGATPDAAGNMRGGLSRDRGTLRIENEGGAWEGPCDSVSRDGGGHIIGSCVLTGSGAYEGYSYLHLHDWGVGGTTEGIIVLGELPSVYPTLPPKPGG